MSQPDLPSIAVLPFTNMSGDADQEYFSDGTEDIITQLSRFRELFVIARNSSFSYKGKQVKVQDIGRDLGVAYIVEGSVRKAAIEFALPLSSLRLQRAIMCGPNGMTGKWRTFSISKMRSHKPLSRFFPFDCTAH